MINVDINQGEAAGVGMRRFDMSPDGQRLIHDALESFRDGLVGSKDQIIEDGCLNTPEALLEVAASLDNDVRMIEEMLGVLG